MENIGFARKTAGDPRAGTSALQSRGRRAGVSAHATHLSSRLGSHAARGHARARRAASGVRARAGSRRRRRDARAHHARHRHRVSVGGFLRAGVRLLRLLPLCDRYAASACVAPLPRGVHEHDPRVDTDEPAVFRTRTGTAGASDHAGLFQDRHSRCAEDKNANGVSTCERIKNARFGVRSPRDSRFGPTRGSRTAFFSSFKKAFLNGPHPGT